MINAPSVFFLSKLFCIRILQPLKSGEYRNSGAWRISFKYSLQIAFGLKFYIVTVFLSKVQDSSNDVTDQIHGLQYTQEEIEGAFWQDSIQCVVFRSNQS